VVQMVRKVNEQVRNKETGKFSIIHLDRIKELGGDLEENEETAGSAARHESEDKEGFSRQRK
jgi:hypothetical protein